MLEPTAAMVKKMMLRLWIALALFLPAVVHAGDVVEHYDIDVVLTPDEKKVSAKVEIKVTAPEGGLTKLDLLLNEGLAVASVQSTAGKVSYTVHEDRVGYSRKAPKAVPVSIAPLPPLAAGESTTLTLVYEGTIVPDPWGVNSAGAGWVELGAFSAWFPYSPDHREFTYDVNVTVGSDFTVAGGEPAGSGGGIRKLTRDYETNDIVIIAARGLQARPLEGGGVLWSVAVDDEIVERIAADLEEIIKQYGEWFGPARIKKMDVVLAARRRGGAYARPGLYVSVFDGDLSRYRALTKNFSHELAHMWWTGAERTTWEDWLNEGFAEYSALMMLRARGDASLYAEYAEAYDHLAGSPPAIWGLDRDDMRAHDALNRKGAGILYRLEQQMGREKFLEWCRTLQKNNVVTTDELLAVLEASASKEARVMVEHALRY